MIKKANCKSNYPEGFLGGIGQLGIGMKNWYAIVRYSNCCTPILKKPYSW